MADTGAKSAKKAAKKRRRNTRKSRMRRALGTVILLMLLAAAVTLAYFVLKVDNVIVTGNTTLTTEHVLETADIQRGTHMWLIDVRGAKAALTADPYIKRADIERIYPSAVRISIVERERAAVIIGMNVIALVDDEGYVLEIDPAGDTAGLLRVMGVGSMGFSVGQMLGEQTDFNSRAMVTIIQALSRHDMLQTIDTVDISNPLSMYMRTDSGFTVQLGQSEDLDDKLDKLAIVLDELEAMGLEGGVINLSAKGDPTYSPQDAAAATGTDVPTNTDISTDTDVSTGTDLP